MENPLYDDGVGRTVETMCSFFASSMVGYVIRPRGSQALAR